MKFRFTGTGDSVQVPCFGCHCLACERARLMSRYRRGPCSAKIYSSGESYLLDAGRMDLADSCERERPAGVLLTHYHADHVQGLLHLRWGVGESIPIYGPRDAEGCADLFKHPGILDFRPGLEPFRPLVLGDMNVIPVPLNHSRPTLGYCIADSMSRLAYLTDTVGLPGSTEHFLRQWQPDIVILDATHPASHTMPRNHNNITMALDILERLNPSQGWLTHLSHDVDAEVLTTYLSLPANVSLAWDGLEIELPD
ncbi:phosphonate metabolism protein PhnP [Halomonas piscis]|uniref:Phosphonate metabolism protein PhnP n=1 Tax=Halomonas piscis TaxID=3031727 RepID=A0ABY9YZJ6_9GAMM|nr:MULTISPECIES: phosphonate metabolism protein PhnP [Halomonas]WNK20295.1 phosphonate metabolism protein PhnP [Halomonas piscis]